MIIFPSCLPYQPLPQITLFGAEILERLVHFFTLIQTGLKYMLVLRMPTTLTSCFHVGFHLIIYPYNYYIYIYFGALKSLVYC